MYVIHKTKLCVAFVIHKGDFTLDGISALR